MTIRAGYTLPESVLSRLSDQVVSWFGLHFPPDRFADLDRCIRAACGHSKAADVAAYANRFLGSLATRDEMEQLASHLTIGETYFFRDKRSLEILESCILPQIHDRHLRIWSAGCSTGEEPYSIAILLRRLVPDWTVTLVATDLNTHSLRKAAEGIYGEWSFRGTPAWVRTGHFTPTEDGRWAIDDSIKRMVKFSHSNLVEGRAPAGAMPMDVILCRNVLMYLHPDATQRAIGHLHRTLRHGGWLLVSPAETSHILFSQFVSVSFGDATLYQKGENRTALPVSFPKTFEARVEELPAAPATEEPAIEVPEKAPDRSPAMLRLARACANQGRLREALEWCQKALHTGKEDPRAHFLEAAILEELGSLDEAARALRRALYLKPDFALAHFVLGNLASRRGEAEQSVKHFSNTLKVLAAHPPDQILPESGGLTAARLEELITRRIKR